MMKTTNHGMVLRPLSELDAEINYLKNYREKLIAARDLRFEVARLESNPNEPGLLGIITDIACKVRDVTVAQLHDGKRTEHLAHTRFIIFYVARQHAGLSLERIGNHFSMDHGSVSNGLQRAEDFKARPDFSKHLRAVEKSFLEHIGKPAAVVAA